MNQLTLLALVGVTSAHPHFFKMINRHHKKHHGGHHGHHKNHHGYHHRDHKEPTMYTPYDFLPIKGKVPDAPVQCDFEEGDILTDSEFYRTLIGGTYKSFVKGWYNSEEDMISEDCLGEWMTPMIEFQKDFHHQIRHDPMATTIEDAHTAANNFVDLHWRNRDSCEIGMIKDDYYNWCLDNEEICLGKDSQYLTRMYENGYAVFGKLYDLFGIMFFENDECYTDEQMIDEHNRVVEDLASLMSYIMGFNLSYDPERVEQHYSWHDFKHEVKGFFHEKHQQMRDAMEFRKNSKKDIFGAEWHENWVPPMPEIPTQEEFFG